MSHTLIKTVEFIGRNNKDIYVSLESPEKDVKNLAKKNEIVIPYTNINVRIDYPLGVSTTVNLVSDESKGFKRSELALKIAKEYQRIYQEEDDAVGKTGNIPNMFNRDFSKGPYQIYGHHLGDLVLHQVINTKNNCFILGVDS